MKYRLNKAEKVPIPLYNVAKTKTINGKDIITYNHWIRLIPGEEYETDDPAMIRWFREYRREERWSSSLESALKSANVPYETRMCKSCGGRVKKISYQVVEVIDD